MHLVIVAFATAILADRIERHPINPSFAQHLLQDAT
jgi:hypothetical protein